MPPADKAPMRKEIEPEDYWRLHPKLISAFCKRGVTREEARELTQETFLQACRGLGSFEERSELDTWVLSIGKRVWLKRLRSRRTQKRNAEELPLEAELTNGRTALQSPTFESEVVNQDFLIQVSHSIQKLPEAMRIALLMYARGIKYREIAVQLGIKENRVASLIHQARTKLRREFC